jgi:hypothetical protein
MKNYIGISRDHSASMTPIRAAAGKDYNRLIGDIKTASNTNQIDTIVSVVKCGVGHAALNVRDVVNSSITTLKPIPEGGYEASGSGTPLFDSVLMLINDLKKVPDAQNPDVSFLVMVVTDGNDNRSEYRSQHNLIATIAELNRTGRWTFVFRVPKGGTRTLVNFGISAGNILEWDQTAKGVEIATQATTSAVEAYYSGVKAGVRSTDKFFTNIDKKEARAVIKTQMKDISNEVTVWNIKAADAALDIRKFIESKGISFIKGTAFYQLVKPEREVQDYKVIIIKDKKAGKVYAGSAARDLLGLPTFGTVKVAPGDHAGYDVYIQSTSVNRKLPEGSRVLFWPDAVTLALA